MDQDKELGLLSKENKMLAFNMLSRLSGSGQRYCSPFASWRQWSRIWKK